MFDSLFSDKCHLYKVNWVKMKLNELEKQKQGKTISGSRESMQSYVLSYARRKRGEPVIALILSAEGTLISALAFPTTGHRGKEDKDDNDDDGGFFLAREDFGRTFDHSFPACTFFFFLVEISSRTLIPTL